MSSHTIPGGPSIEASCASCSVVMGVTEGGAHSQAPFCQPARTQNFPASNYLGALTRHTVGRRRPVQRLQQQSEQGCTRTRVMALKSRMTINMRPTFIWSTKRELTLCFSICFLFKNIFWQQMTGKWKWWFRGQIRVFSFRYTEFLVTADNPCENVHQDEHRLKTQKKVWSIESSFFLL